MVTKLAKLEQLSTGEKFISSKNLSPREYHDMRKLQDMRHYASTETMMKAVENCKARGWEFEQSALEFLGI